MVAEILRSLVIADDREIGADGQKHDARTVLAKRGIELQRACQQFDAEERSRAVADQHDLLRVAGADDIDEMLGKAVDPLIPVRALAMRELPGPDRVRQEIEDVSSLLRV